MINPRVNIIIYREGHGDMQAACDLLNEQYKITCDPIAFHGVPGLTGPIGFVVETRDPVPDDVLQILGCMRFM